MRTREPHGCSARARAIFSAMQHRSLGVTGLKVSRLGLGTMTWGRATDEHEARDQLIAFAEAGGTLVDTAAGYVDGRAESMLGALIGDVVARDEVVLATKAASPGGVDTARSTRRVDISCRPSTPPCADSAPTTSTCGRCTCGPTRRRSRRR